MIWKAGSRRSRSRTDSREHDRRHPIHQFPLFLGGLITCMVSGSRYPARHQFDAVISKQDLVGFYWPAFETCIKDAQVQAVMCSYNSVTIEGDPKPGDHPNGVPSCANGALNDGVLREQWGFDGLMVSDCTAISDFTTWNSKVSCSTAQLNIWL